MMTPQEYAKRAGAVLGQECPVKVSFRLEGQRQAVYFSCSESADEFIRHQGSKLSAVLVLYYSPRLNRYVSIPKD